MESNGTEPKSIDDILPGNFLGELPTFLQTLEIATLLASYRDGTGGLKEEVDGLYAGSRDDYSRMTDLDSACASINPVGCTFATFERRDGKRIIRFYNQKQEKEEGQEDGEQEVYKIDPNSSRIIEGVASPSAEGLVLFIYYIDRQSGKSHCVEAISFHGDQTDRGLGYFTDTGHLEKNYFDRNKVIKNDDMKPIYDHLVANLQRQ